MKTELHPTYFSQAKVVCACGNKFTTGATVAEIKLEICSQCHPYFTGREKLVDTEGRVDKFQRRMASKVVPKTKKAEAPRESRPSSLKEMLQAARKQSKG
jgi:large subunit ribosomal protein L31